MVPKGCRVKGHPQGQSKSGVSGYASWGLCYRVSARVPEGLSSLTPRTSLQVPSQPPSHAAPPPGPLRTSFLHRCLVSLVLFVSAANSWPSPAAPCSEDYPIIPLAQRVLPSSRAISSRPSRSLAPSEGRSAASVAPSQPG